ncbi:MAG: permease [Leptolyngbya foveolarum]|uniref:Permease n=1 Tax=Leptolyngbya foveolarum TaxID=47253 RepID=A0A2W4WKN4_9CYAN|nr:MAG: permease [Leptolyngbya foveolarum]
MIVVAQARPSERAEFIKKTYLHLAGAVAAFIGVEFVFFALGIAEFLGRFVAGSQFGWLAMLGGFMLLGYLSSSFASKAGDINAQYMGLGIYVLGEAVMFAPLLWIADAIAPGAISSAAVVTLFLFGGLTAVVFTTGQDFSFLGGALKVFGMIALGLIVCSFLFKGLTLGIWFSFAMVAFAGAAILYQTSQVMKRYPTDYYVAASLALFSSVMLLFWYVLRIFMSRR